MQHEQTPEIDKETAKRAAKALGWGIDRDGFLIHKIRDHEQAQRVFNAECAAILARK